MVLSRPDLILTVGNGESGKVLTDRFSLNCRRSAPNNERPGWGRKRNVRFRDDEARKPTFHPG
ncbi:hypothetical protein MES4922_30099 [Mesorhizobium ventifaucium]|uniref:Uncharacterized protein n=1 Tax=Mesorhizobium ventifaucium TaxID=666020 RepID=A0ABN8JVF9_9HYPH|nr:hypothetical protein MES4922_30099 [Mesorhizobium ventifaucium]